MNNRLPSTRIFDLILLISDIAISIGAFMLGLWVVGGSAFLRGDIEAIVGLTVLSLTSISFYQTYNLYSYHVLFSQKIHLKNLAKSFCWSSLTLSIIVFLFNSSHLMNNYYNGFLILLFFGTVVILFLSRYLGAHLLNFMMAVGLAFFFVGVTGIVCQKGIPVFMVNVFILYSCFSFAIVLLTLNRIILVHVIFNYLLRRRYRRQVVIVGSDQEAEQIARHVVENNAPFWIVGTIGQQPEESANTSVGKKQLGGIEKLPEIVAEFDINDIIITDENIDKPRLTTILDYCTSNGINAWFSPKLLPIINIKLFIDNFCGIPMILLCSQKHSRIFNHLKHSVDLFATSLIFIIVLPFSLLIALSIKLDSKGPVFYRPRAIGKNGVEFLMYKFRSMLEDSDNSIHKNYVSQLIKGEISKEEDDDTPLKITDDPRVTKIGKIIRKFSLDELPQLINVFQGTMSLVGPRPCLPYEYEMYQEWYKKRTSVRPGITGLWQIAGRSEVAFEDMILLDFYYIYNRSLVLDFNILFETIFVVLEKKGAY